MIISKGDNVRKPGGVGIWVEEGDPVAFVMK
jgi:hypothetical protein